MSDLLVVVCGDYLPVHLYVVVLDVDRVSTAGSHPVQRETRNEAIYLTSEDVSGHPGISPPLPAWPD